MDTPKITWEKDMRKFFRWLYRECSWKMFQWIWGLDKKQVTHIRDRVDYYEPRFKEKEFEDGGHEISMEISNPFL